MSDYNVEWADGVKTRLTYLHQNATYAGLLEGIPTLDINQRWYINPVVDLEGKPKRLLLWAPQTPYEGSLKSFAHSPTALLPSVRCIATFNHFAAARAVPDDGLWVSYIEVVWFQEEWALPIIPEVLSKIKSLNWSDVAIDYEL